MKLLASIALASVVGCCLIVVTAAPARAACTDARAVSSSLAGRASFLYTPGHPFAGEGRPGGGSVTYYIRGVFWSYGGGDPAYGVGNDSGYFRGILPYGVNSWLLPSYAGDHAGFMGGTYGHWQYTTVDGCISRDGTDPKGVDPEECLVVLLTDQGLEATSYFALLSTPASVNTGDFEFTPHTGFPEQIRLAPIPAPEILRSSRGRDSVTVEVSVTPGALDREHGYYLKCHGEELLDGYRLYVRRHAAGSAPPPGFDSQALLPRYGSDYPPWEPLTPEAISIEQNARVVIPCSPGEDLYLCATLTFGGVRDGAASYELLNCSANSAKIACASY